MKIVVVLLLAVVAAGIPAIAGAADLFRDPRQQYSDPRLQYSDPRLQYSDPRSQYPDPRQPKPDPRQQPGAGQHPVAPAVIVITQPVYIAAPPSCVVPGYWAYSWVPQSYVSSAWVPGSYNADALWIEGHYEPSAYTWGYYQPYWVPERTSASG